VNLIEFFMFFTYVPAGPRPDAPLRSRGGRLDETMKPHHLTEEKARPFRLVKYFTYTSLVFLFLGILVLSLLNTHWARSMQLKKSEDYAHLLIENLNHQVFLQFIFPVALKYGKIQLRDEEQFKRMDRVVRSTLHSFKVENVNIYDMNHTVSYSFDSVLIGKKELGGSAYHDALKGEWSSKLVQRGSFWEILLGSSRDSKLITFAPLRAEQRVSRLSGPVLGVVEIVQDMSEDYRAIFKFQILVILTLTVVMGLLFLCLVFVVNRGEKIIEKRALERLRLKEKLSRSEHLSSLGEMVAGVSHEIRNPLGIISSSAALLKKKMNEIDPKNTIPDIIVEEAGRLNNIITDFLNFAKPINPDLRACRIDQVLEKNITFLQNQLLENGYAVHCRFDTPSPEIPGDAALLYQAFLNLLINAMQAMPDGGDIGVEIQAAPDRVTVIVDDQGVGISEGLLEKIWDPFFTTKELGTGLGLGIVRNIIKAHGGTISIGNGESAGARVTVTLPLNSGE
jgi:two-component system, NtrC family, sensor histidine kinase HydH